MSLASGSVTDEASRGAAGVADLFGTPPSEAVVVGLRQQLLTQLPAFAGHFALGMGLAYVFVRVTRGESGLLDRLRSARVGAAALAASALAVVLTWYWWGHERVVAANKGSVLLLNEDAPVVLFAQLAFAAAFTAFAGCVVLGVRWCRWPWSTAPARRLGDVSYGVFLWHYVALYYLVFNVRLQSRGPEEQMISLLVCATSIALVFAWASRRFVEEPAIRWARRITKGWGAPAGTAAPSTVPVPA